MSRDDIRGLKSVPKDLYRNTPLADLAAFGLAKIEELEERLTIENICVALHKLFPEKFSMLGYPEYPDGMRVNRTLLQMQPKYRNYATGSANKGYSLSEIGLRVAEGLKQYFNKRSKSKSAKKTIQKDKDKSSRSFSDDKLVDHIRQSDLFSLFSSGEMDKARGIEMLAILKAFSHTPKKELKRKFNEFIAAAQNQHDTEVLAFLEICKMKFSDLLK